MAQQSPTRTFPRFPFDSRVTVTTFRSGAKCCFWGRAANISESGLAATVTSELNVGEPVTLQFFLGKDAVEVRASVRFKNGHFCGFEFLVLGEQVRAIIRKTCEQLRSR